MDDVTIARAVHVIAIVFWIGGVAMVTTVLLPAVRRFKSAEERVTFFETVERYVSPGRHEPRRSSPVRAAFIWSIGLAYGRVFSQSNIGGLLRWS